MTKGGTFPEQLSGFVMHRLACVTLEYGLVHGWYLMHDHSLDTTN